jgi:hypothetical protein
VHLNEADYQQRHAPPRRCRQQHPDGRRHPRNGPSTLPTSPAANLFLTAEGTTAGTWTGPTSGAVNFVFTGGGGNDIFNFAANSVDGMDQVFGGLGTDIVSVNITGMGVSGTAMSGGLHFEDTETIRLHQHRHRGGRCLDDGRLASS